MGIQVQEGLSWREEGEALSDLLHYIQFDTHRLPNQKKILLQKN